MLFVGGLIGFMAATVITNVLGNLASQATTGGSN
jgi:hypothetical protein